MIFIWLVQSAFLFVLYLTCNVNDDIESCKIVSIGIDGVVVAVAFFDGVLKCAAEEITKQRKKRDDSRSESSQVDLDHEDQKYEVDDEHNVDTDSKEEI